jgi:hypothetical protein
VFLSNAIFRIAVDVGAAADAVDEDEDEAESKTKMSDLPRYETGARPWSLQLAAWSKRGVEYLQHVKEVKTRNGTYQKKDSSAS